MHYLYKSLLPVNSTCSNLLLGNFPAIRQTYYLAIDVLNHIGIKNQELASPAIYVTPNKQKVFIVQ